jgi:RNA polymerase sigma factor (sigma-70 family)
LGFERNQNPEGGVAVNIVLYCETKGEERVACAQAGCEDCLAALLRENDLLIYTIISRQWIREAEGKDLRQIGRIAFWYALQHYDPQRGMRFSTFAWMAIRHRVWQAIAQATKLKGWLETPLHQDQIGELNAEWQRVQLRRALEEGLADLSERQRQVIEWYYGWDGAEARTFAEIGRDWQVSRQRIREIHDGALVVLRVPGLSIQLRSLSERHSRAAYRAALQKNCKWQRASRGRK